MSESSSETTSVLRTPKVILAIVVAVVILIVWLLVFLLPSNSKISSYRAQLPQLQAKQAQLNAEVEKLQKIAAGQGPLTAKLAQLATAVPPASDDNANLNYLHSIYATEAQAGVTQLTISEISAPASAQTSTIVAIPITLSIQGTYDQGVIFMKLLYNLPRLTTISSVDMTGGGPESSRSTPLDMSISADIYANTSASAPAVPANLPAGTPSTSQATGTLPQCSTPTQPTPRDPLDPTLTPQSPLLTVPTCLPAGMPAVAPTTTTPAKS
jgi:Tfp pilus assembly protein PilO